MAGIGRNIALTIGDLGWRIESSLEARTLLDAGPISIALAFTMAIAVGVVMLAGVIVVRRAALNEHRRNRHSAPLRTCRKLQRHA